MDDTQLSEQRRQKDHFFKAHPQSPLTPAQRAAFDGLRWYPPNPALDLTVTAEPFTEQTQVQVQTTGGTAQTFTRWGQFTFEVDGQPARLTLFEADYGFFLPFVDSGAGTETYPAGRYLEPKHLGGGRFHIDFNRAYNPYCAYNDGWTCPITPPENRLKVAVRAGELLPAGAGVGLA